MIKSTLIISTYEWPDALNLVLKSLLVQSRKPDEVIIADDGSTVETKRLIDSFKKKTSLNIYHIWQEDKGFRKAKILNKAIIKSTGKYLIQIDGDCIMHRHFIRDHMSLAKNNCFLFGSRVNIKQEYLVTLFKKEQINFTLFSKGIKKRTRALYIPLFSETYKAKAKFSKKYRGCNTSYFKNDALKVNGYNEDFEGWGREDSEFALRLINSGVNSRRIRYKGIVFHIYHYEKPKNKLEENNHIEYQTITLKKTWCENGINKYLSENK